MEDRRSASWKRMVVPQFGRAWLEMKARPLWTYTHRRRMEAVGGLLKEGGLVLDVGCGDGEMLVATVSKEGFSGVGLDFSKPLLEAAQGLVRRRGLERKVSLVLGDAEALPFEENIFHAVYCAGTIEHLPKPERCIAEMGRVVRASGRVVVVTNTPLYGVLDKLGSRFRHRTLTFKFLAQSLRRRGLGIVYLDGFLLINPFRYDLLEGFERRLPRFLRLLLLADMAVVGIKEPRLKEASRRVSASI